MLKNVTDISESNIPEMVKDLFKLIEFPSDDPVINKFMTCDAIMLIRKPAWTDVKAAHSEKSNVFVQLEWSANLVLAKKLFCDKWNITKKCM